jgi:glutathione S-transferase
VITALDRLESELGGNEYLVGDRFSVADLTAAALFYPLVLPPEGPDLGDPPEAFQRFRQPLEDRTGYEWVAEIYRNHRAPAGVTAPIAA